MNIKITTLFVLFTFMISSCKNQNKELPSSEQEEVKTEPNLESENEATNLDKTAIMKQVQGKWKEIAYPYRTAEFVDSTVKFVEEGTQNPPSSQPFEITNNCTFENNNIRDLQSGDIILSLPESERCEKLTVSNDTLTLNGYSTNTNGDYDIVYLKLE